MSATASRRFGWVPIRSTTVASGRGWLRAAVLGADDGIVSTASLLVGVAAANASRAVVITAGLAGLVAGPTPLRGAAPVTVGGGLAMAVTAWIGWLAGGIGI